MSLSTNQKIRTLVAGLAGVAAFSLVRSLAAQPTQQTQINRNSSGNAKVLTQYAPVPNNAKSLSIPAKGYLVEEIRPLISMVQAPQVP